MIGSNAIEILIGLRDNATSKLTSLERQIVKTSNAVKMASIAMIGAGSAGIGVLSMWAKQGAEATDIMDRFNVVFGQNAEIMRKWAIDTSRSLGLNRYEVEKLVSSYALFLKNMGISGKEAEDMAKNLTILTYDLAEFLHLSPEEVFEKLKRGLAGQGRGLVDLGFKLDETTLKQYTLNEKLGEASKILANYKLIMDKTKDAQGAWKNSLQEADNRIDIAKNKLKEMTTTLGIAVLPFFALGADIITNLVERFNSLDESTKNNIARLLFFGSVGLIITGVLGLIGAQLRTLTILSTPLYLKILGIALAFDLVYRIIALNISGFGRLMELVGHFLHLKGMEEFGKRWATFGMEQAKLGGIGAFFETAGIKGINLGTMFKTITEVGKTININATFKRSEEVAEMLGKQIDKVY